MKFFTLIIILMSTIASNAQHSWFEKRPEVGQEAPQIELTDENGATYNLKETLEEGPVLVVFYRGKWCPYCNRHLSEIQEGLEELKEVGLAAVWGISPQLPENIEKTRKKSEVAFPLLYDKDYEAMEAYGVRFEMERALVGKYKLFGINVAKTNGQEEHILPVPASFLIGKDGVIKWLHFDEDYKERSSVEELMEALRSLN